MGCLFDELFFELEPVLISSWSGAVDVGVALTNTSPIFRLHRVQGKRARLASAIGLLCQESGLLQLVGGCCLAEGSLAFDRERSVDVEFAAGFDVENLAAENLTTEGRAG